MAEPSSADANRILLSIVDGAWLPATSIETRTTIRVGMMPFKFNMLNDQGGV